MPSRVFALAGTVRIRKPPPVVRSAESTRDGIPDARVTVSIAMHDARALSSDGPRQLDAADDGCSAHALAATVTAIAGATRIANERTNLSQ